MLRRRLSTEYDPPHYMSCVGGRRGENRTLRVPVSGLLRRGAFCLRTVVKMLRGGGVVLLLVLGLLAPPFLQPSAYAATVSDNFNRANGGLGSNWDDR
jgi:hypothetical protein